MSGIDGRIFMNGDDMLQIEVRLKTTYEVDGLIKVLGVMRNWLTSRRDMVAGDIGVDWPRRPTLAEEMELAGL